MGTVRSGAHVLSRLPGWSTGAGDSIASAQYAVVVTFARHFPCYVVPLVHLPAILRVTFCVPAIHFRIHVYLKIRKKRDSYGDSLFVMEFANKDETDMYLYLVDHGLDESVAKVFEGMYKNFGYLIIHAYCDPPLLLASLIHYRSRYRRYILSGANN